jgi:hypothetical protein
LLVVLDDAQAVDPQVPDAQLAGELDGVLETLRELGPDDLLPVGGEAARQSTEEWFVAPAVTECSVRGRLVVRLVQTDIALVFSAHI